MPSRNPTSRQLLPDLYNQGCKRRTFSLASVFQVLARVLSTLPLTLWAFPLMLRNSPKPLQLPVELPCWPQPRRHALLLFPSSSSWLLPWLPQSLPAVPLSNANKMTLQLFLAQFLNSLHQFHKRERWFSCDTGMSLCKDFWQKVRKMADRDESFRCFWDTIQRDRIRK